MSGDNLLSMQHISKSFHQVPVLKDVSFDVRHGEIHALLGENGAGKSTLMNILGGIYQPNKGTIKINGKKVEMTDPREAQKYGISFIHQELNVVTDLKVYENLFLGSELRNAFGILDEKEMCRQTEAILAKLNVYIHPKTYVRDLDTSYKQLIEISKALLHQSKLIIMDEPTTALAEHEVDRLFTFMRKLRETGVSIIYISHKLKEIEQICDRYTVLRDGVVVSNGFLKDVDLDAITRMMVGKLISQDRFEQKGSHGDVLLEVNHLTAPGIFQDVHFQVRKGEIVGFTGLAGDGRTEVFESIIGHRKKYSGSIKINGKAAKMEHPKQALKAGIGYVPKDRKENAIIKDLSVTHNLTLATLHHVEKNGFISEREEKKKVQYYKEKLNIKVHRPSITIDKLSGGNQQKVIIAKWLEANTDIIIFDHPTQGIDVGAKQEIYELIMELAEQGKGIIIISSEATEVMKVCHTLYVMYQGEITATFNGDEATEDLIMSYATGSKKGDKAYVSN